MKKDVIIIGAGAAGMMCAVTAGKRGRSTVVIDHAPHIGQKIHVSGGGRCNFTNLNMQPENYISSNLHFCKSALARFTPDDFLSLVKKHRIRFLEKEKGQMFCEGSSSQIVDMFKKECDSAGVKFQLNCGIIEIVKKNMFIVKTNANAIESGSLVIASGGLSYPNLKASDLGLRIAKQFKLSIVLPRPALVPLAFSGADREQFRQLSGVSFRGAVKCNGHEFIGEVLFTHRGLSGPAILQASLYWDHGKEIIIDLLPGIESNSMFLSHQHSRIEMKNLLAQHLPKRFAHAFCEYYLPSKPLCQFNEKELLAASILLHNWRIKPSGTEGYAAAEVTSGGIDTNELSSKTMEAKKVPGLFFIGEVVDVTGHLGGYNLHWAWASGSAAGAYV